MSSKKGRVSSKNGRVSSKKGRVLSNNGRVSSKKGRVSSKKGHIINHCAETNVLILRLIQTHSFLLTQIEVNVVSLKTSAADLLYVGKSSNSLVVLHTILDCMMEKDLLCVNH